MGVIYANLNGGQNKPVNAQYGNYGLVFQDDNEEYHSKYFGDHTKVNYLLNPFAKDGWKYFILNTSKGFTKAGIQAFNDSIRSYVYCILSAQVQVRCPIVGNFGNALDAQTQFVLLLEDAISGQGSETLVNSVKRYLSLIHI